MIKRISYLIVLVWLAVTITACGILQEPAAPSATIEAIPVVVSTSTAVPPTDTPAPTDTPSASEAAATEPAATEPSPTEPSPTEPPPTATAPAGELRIYSISQTDSQVRFELDEDLAGQRLTVIGSTNQVAGEIALNLNDLSTAQVGVLQINARTLATDNDFRNRAIQNRILETDSYEFITFTPTAVNGLPANATVGQEITFSIDGDLTIRDQTYPVTFQVTATAVSDTQFSGSATTIINRTDFDLQIPSVPDVANVEEEVELYITFVANAQ